METSDGNHSGHGWAGNLWFLFRRTDLELDCDLERRTGLAERGHVIAGDCFINFTADRYVSGEQRRRSSACVYTAEEEERVYRRERSLPAAA